MKNKLTSLSKK